MSKLTNKERELTEALGECWSAFEKLEEQHPSDHDEFIHHIHILQRQVMARPTRRDEVMCIEKVGREG